MAPAAWTWTTTYHGQLHQVRGAKFMGGSVERTLKGLGEGRGRTIGGRGIEVGDVGDLELLGTLALAFQIEWDGRGSTLR